MSERLCARERLERIDDLRELIKYERQNMLAEVVEDPGSLEANLVSISLRAMERELAELERGALAEGRVAAEAR
jgi:hypothetical protein